MPIERCRSKGKPGFRVQGTMSCHTYTSGNKSSRELARRKAEAQLRAIKANQRGSK